MNRKYILCLIASALLSGLACAQSAVTDPEAQLHGKDLFLRGNWAGNDLRFDGNGKPESDYGTLPFTESGFTEESLKRKGNTLKIKGQRVGLKFDSKGVMSRFKIENMTIEIKGDASTDFDQALSEIFAPDLAALVPTLPSWWQTYAHKHFLRTPSETPETSSTAPFLNPGPPEARVFRIGGSVTKPKVLSAPNASFSELARKQKFSGNVEVYLRVGEDGIPFNLRLVRPAGMGLDEQAINAVSKYRFTPATKDGKPVTVDLYIDVNFQVL